MIEVAGSARRSFVFPGELPAAYAYYADVGRLLGYLPHICLMRAYGVDRFRLLYSSTELGIYHIRIFADVQAVLEDGWILGVRPLDGVPPVKAEADLHRATAHGYFSSRSVFHGEGDQTRIDYGLQLRAELPAPLGLRFVPGMVIDGIARSIVKKRTREIVEGFIERSTEAFPHWRDEMRNHGSWPEPGPAPVTSPPIPDCPDQLF